MKKKQPDDDRSFELDGFGIFCFVGVVLVIAVVTFSAFQLLQK